MRSDRTFDPLTNRTSSLFDAERLLRCYHLAMHSMLILPSNTLTRGLCRGMDFRALRRVGCFPDSRLANERVHRHVSYPRVIYNAYCVLIVRRVAE